MQTNIIMLDISKTGLTADEYCAEAKDRGLWIRPVLEDKVRLVFYKGVNRKDADFAIKIIKDIDNSL